MAGLADLLYAFSGQPNPQQQIADFLSGRQTQPPGGQGAGPPGANPQPPNGPAPDPNAPPPNPSPGDPAPPGSPPQPQALQSTPQMNASYNQLANGGNLMDLYLRLQQRQAASDQINKGFALIAANHAGNPAMARAIMDSVSGGGGASGMVGDLMSLYNAQTQMAGQQQMLANADAIDAKNGWPPGTARAMILSGRGSEVVQDMRPTDLQRNYEWARSEFKKNNPNASEAEIDAGAQSILLGAGGGGAVGSDLRSMNLAKSAWLNEPANKDKPLPGYLTDVTKWKIYSQDLSDAKQQFNGVNDSLNKFMNDMSEVANNPNLDKITGSTGNIMTGAIQGLLPGEVNNLKTAMSGLTSEAKDIASRGGPKGVGQNLRTVGSAAEDFTNASLTNYRDTVIAPRMRQALTAQANANGAAGQFNSMPRYLRHYADQMYQAGGDLDIGGSPRANTPDKGPDGKPLPQPDAAHLQDFYTALEHRGPEFALKHLKDAGFDTSSLR